jgi:chemotaxis protein MotB
MRTAISLLLVAVALAANGCVSQSKYDKAVATTQLTQAELNRTKAALEQTESEARRYRDQAVDVQSQLDALTVASDTERTESSKAAAELRARLQETRAAQIAWEQRAALFRSLALKLKKQVDAGDLAIVIRDGRMVIELPNDVLFDTGQTDIKPQGRDALKAIASALTTVESRHFQVAGHTDNVPIHNERFASNWELSSGRALRVVHFLIDQGVQPATLSAAGYADQDPVSRNDNADGRKRNRRTEITLEPNISEMIRVP